MKQPKNKRMDWVPYQNTYYKFMHGVIRSSVNEIVIGKCLHYLGIKHRREVSFKGLVNPETGNLLRFDFFIPSQNKLIEFDGGFHNRPDVQKRDRIKDAFAALHGIELVRINAVGAIYKYFGVEDGKFGDSKRLEKVEKVIENPIKYDANGFSKDIRKQVNRYKRVMQEQGKTILEVEFCHALAMVELFMERNFKEHETSDTDR